MQKRTLLRTYQSGSDHERVRLYHGWDSEARQENSAHTIDEIIHARRDNLHPIQRETDAFVLVGNMQKLILILRLYEVVVHIARYSRPNNFGQPTFQSPKPRFLLPQRMPI